MTLPDEEYFDKPLRGKTLEEHGVVLVRTSQERMDDYFIYTNVPHLFHHHSPTGFEWGYGGSGPTDLAFVISELYLRRLGWKGVTMTTHSKDVVSMLAYRLRNEVKRRWIAGMPDKGGTIPHAELEGFFKGEMALAQQSKALTHEDSATAEYWQFEEAFEDD